MSRKISNYGATPENATNDEAETQNEAPKRTRTYMHTARIVKTKTVEGSTVFCAMYNGKVSAQFKFDDNTAEFTRLTDVMGAYEGFPKFYRTHQELFSTVLLTKSEDAEVALAQVDPYTVEAFLRNYLDRLTVKAQLAANEPSEVDPDRTATD